MKLRRWESTNFFEVHSLQFPNPWKSEHKMCKRAPPLSTARVCLPEQHFTMDYYTQGDITYQLIKNISYKLTKF